MIIILHIIFIHSDSNRRLYCFLIGFKKKSIHNGLSVFSTRFKNFWYHLNRRNDSQKTVPTEKLSSFSMVS